MAEERLKHIVRVANTDLIGQKKLGVALTKIRGIGAIYANMICKLTNTDTKMRAGHLTSTQVEKLNDCISNPDKYKIPSWMRNRRKDFTTGQDKHLLVGDLQFTQQQDVRRLQKIRSYRGIRHARGSPVRGQRTKSNFRRNKGRAVGVKKRAGAKSGRV
jgi:small subunit ribosomal protein S13